MGKSSFSKRANITLAMQCNRAVTFPVTEVGATFLQDYFFYAILQIIWGLQASLETSVYHRVEILEGG